MNNRLGSCPRAPRSRRLIGIAAAVALLPILAIEATCAERSALWHVVHDLCVVDQRNSGHPTPCEEVHISDGEDDGYVVLKDLLGRTQYLVIPTRNLPGIESPELLAADAPNYWRAAWAARSYVSRRAGVELPRDAIGMAVNSAPGRSQDQLHIHVDCVRLDVANDIRRHSTAFDEVWAPLPFDLNGRAYLARRVWSADLGDVNLFRLLAQAFDATQNSADETLVVIGATFDGDRPGFVLLAGRADPEHGDSAHGEELLDHSCLMAGDAAGLSGGPR